MSEKLQSRKLAKQEAAFIERLWPIVSELYEAIEEGAAQAQAFFESHGKEEDIDWHLFSHLVRWHVCKRLDGKQDVSAAKFERESLALSGIEVAYRTWLIKVFKADDGELPAAGKSGRRQSFYQRSLFESEDDQFTCTNWVLIWDTDARGNLGDIQLVLPNPDGLPHKSGQQVRAITVPHPAEFAKPRLAYSSDVPREIEFEDDAEVLEVALKGGGDDER